MNKLNRKIPLQYVTQKLRSLNWHDISFLLDKGYLEYQAAIEYAAEMIGNIPEHEEVLVELMVLSQNEIAEGVLVKEHVAKLARNVEKLDKQKSFDKVLFLIMSWVYDHRKQRDEPLYGIFLIAEDFDFPRSIIDLYRPYDEFAAYQDWEKYLRDEAVRWGK